VNPYEDNSAIPMYPGTDDVDVYQLPKDMRDGSDVLDQMIQLDLVKKKKANDFLKGYIA
jgi:hypothetical protein